MPIIRRVAPGDFYFKKTMAPEIDQDIDWHRILILTALGLASLMPIIPILSNIHWHDNQRLYQIILIIISAFVIWQKPLIEPFPRKFILVTYILIIIGATSAYHAYTPFWGIAEIGLLIGTMGLAFATYQISDKIHRIDDALIHAASFLCAGVTTKFIVAYVAALDQPEIGFIVHEMLDGFSNRRFFGQVATLLIPLLLSVHFFRSGSVPRRCLPAIWALVCLVWFVVMATGTRGTWLALAVSGWLIFWVAGAAGRLLAISLLASAVAGLTLTYVLLTVIPSHLIVEVAGHPVERLTTTLSGREILWTLSWEMIRENPWLGVGPMHFAAAHHAVAAHPHNAPLQLAAEWGIPATVLVSSLVLFGLWRLLRTIRFNAREINQVNGLRIAIFASLTGAAVQSMVDGVIVMPTTMVWLAILIGWAWSLEPDPVHNMGNRREPQASGLSSRRSINRLVVILPFAAASCTLLYIAARDIPQIIEMETSGVASDRMPGPLLPRFWIRGWIGSGPD